MTVIGWKVWFADGRVAAGATPEEWAALPEDGVLIVMLYYDEFTEADPELRYRRILQGNDSYWLSRGEADHIYGQSDEAAAAICERYPGAVVKRGKWTDDESYRLAAEAAMTDHDYAPFE